MTSREWARSGRSWTAALASMRADRTARPEIREERLRTTAGLRGSPAVALSAWRGRSGRRYVVGVHDVAAAATIDDPGPAVILGVRRDADGIAVIVGLGHDGTIAEGAALAAADGATEIHLHRLADGFAAREAIIRDLGDEEPCLPPGPDPLGASRSVAARRPAPLRGVAADALRDRGRG